MANEIIVNKELNRAKEVIDRLMEMLGFTKKVLADVCSALREGLGREGVLGESN